MGRKQKVPRIYENENTIYQTLWKRAMARLRGKFISISTYIKKNFSNKQPNNVP
jgi:hypothetical protein